jgi:RNA-directed DNA polymerase
MALAPIAEHTADPHSYGFRGYLGVADAVEQVRTAMSGQNAPRWVLDADIRGCFDNISHKTMINNIPMDKSILNQWLKCGYYDEQGHYTPTVKGTPQGGVISPLLCNMVLDGLEQVVINAAGSNPKVHVIRYADDFIVTAPDKELLEQNIIPAIEAFLDERGLTLHPDKTQTVHVDDGFNFLGHHFVGTPNGKLRITPSRVKINAFLTKVGMLVKGCSKQGLFKLFHEVLNPRIQGWAKSYQTVHAKEAYDNVDKKIHSMVMKCLLRLLPHLSKKQIRDKYVVPIRGGRTFAIPCPAGGLDRDGKRVRLFKASSLRKVAHEKASSRVNAFDPDGKLTLEKRRKRNRAKKQRASREI